MNQKKVSKSYLARIVLFLVICAGLMYLTDSFFMSLGILLVLFVLDELVRRWDVKRMQKRQCEEMEKDE
ncbi:MAG: transporter [Prevotella sp.]|jgi:Flp pilus assembly protein TadB|uniref:Transporter n=1 Tax=Segatella cerevisiae TaxID=2053716 RepID=A0ABT1BWD9_9BACT|nr:transporter [Segatella cerevisiae]MCH3995465.1 transporter [Prevotella sp.]MCI1247159.1 transporter [Prevotella sp.]MCO6025394.1 transporter [Segatella cerevisiae]